MRTRVETGSLTPPSNSCLALTCGEHGCARDGGGGAAGIRALAKGDVHVVVIVRNDLQKEFFSIGNIKASCMRFNSVRE